MMDGPAYPVSFSVDYPDRELDRMTSALRIFTVIPIAIVLGAIAGRTWQWSYDNGTSGVAAGAGGLLFFGPLPVRLDYPYPDAARDLNRWLPLVKWLLAIPHYIVLFFLDIAAVVAVIEAWFAIVFTSRYPRGLFGLVESVARWHNRVIGYAVTLVTDSYPPFRLAPEPEPPRRG
jgi:hypothetical protein